MGLFLCSVVVSHVSQSALSHWLDALSTRSFFWVRAIMHVEHGSCTGVLSSVPADITG